MTPEGPSWANALHTDRVAVLAAVILALVLLAGLAGAAPAMAEFHLERFAIGVQNENGTPDAQAGSHPYSLTTTFTLTVSQGTIRDAQVALPPGFVGDRDATASVLPRLCCGEGRGSPVSQRLRGRCRDHLRLRERDIRRMGGLDEAGVQSLPPKGVAAEFGYIAGPTPVLLRTSVRTGGDYGVTTAAPKIGQAVLVAASKVTIWGVPANPAHDPIRGQCQQNVKGAALPFEQPGRGLLPEEAGLETPIHRRSDQATTTNSIRVSPNRLGKAKKRADVRILNRKCRC